MGIFLNIVLLYILPANFILLFLFKKDICRKIGNNFSLLFSYGVAPLLSGLFLYYLTWFLPKRSESFYVFVVALFWIVVFFYSKDKIREIGTSYKNIIDSFKNNFSVTKYGAYFVVLFFAILFSVQTLFYPISENDSAYYFAQSQALHQSLDAHWYESGAIMLNSRDVYPYNAAIRPGIPATMAFSFLFGGRENNYFMFNFFSVYYYYLLIGILMLIVSRLAISLGKNPKASIFQSLLFFVFYWNMTRFYIFNNKEVVIYFLALMGLCLVYDLILEKNRNVKKEILLGIVLGLNSFVNLHGIIIGIFLLFLLFVFSKLSFWQRTRQIILIFGVNLLFSAFEFLLSFGFIFINTAKDLFKSSTVVQIGQPTDQAWAQRTELLHESMYQVKNIKDVYLKGKLQIMTNIGSYGLYFWFFLLVLVSKFKEIMGSVFGKIILVFMAVYYLIIIDPLNLNKNELAIVLWGSPKYSMFVVLISIIISSVYFEEIVSCLFKYVYNNKLRISVVAFISAAFVYFFKFIIIAFGMNILQMLVQINRDTSFYLNKIELFYYAVLISIVSIGVYLTILHFMKIKKGLAYKIFYTFCLFFMVMPFFIVNVGKIPLGETFNMLNENRQEKLQDVIYFGDLFKVYYYAKNNLPKGAIVQTDLIETYTYNDYFKLRWISSPEAKYGISGKCLSSEEIYRAGIYSLCKI